MMFEHIIQIPEHAIDGLAHQYERQLTEIRDILLEASQDASDFCAAMKSLDFEELTLVAAIGPYERMIEQLEIDHCRYDCENGRGDFWDVTFSFETADHAALFEEAVRTHGL